MPDRFTIRRARRADFLAIAALDRVAWRDNRHSRFIPDGEHIWRHWVDGALVYAARRRGRCIGAILAIPCVDGTYWLHKIFVRKSERGRGVASALFRRLMREMDRQNVAVSLTVDPVNRDALALYRKWGFTRARLVRGFYRAHEDRLVLTRPAHREN